MTPPAPIRALLRAPAFGVLARAILTLPYWWSGIAKMADLKGALAEVASLDLKPAALIVAATISVQLGGAVALILGRSGWLAAGALGVFTALATLIAHPYWAIASPTEHFHALNTFLEHIGLIGGLMLAAILVEKERRA